MAVRLLTESWSKVETQQKRLFFRSVSCAQAGSSPLSDSSGPMGQLGWQRGISVPLGAGIFLWNQEFAYETPKAEQRRYFLLR